jgi:SSS family solute:Na+ symporter
MELSGVGATILSAVLVIYAATLVSIGWFAGRKVENAEDFLLAGRSVPLGLSILSLLATWFGSSAILGATRSSYELGLHGTVLEPFACAATLTLTGLVFAAPLRKRQVATVADLFRQRMGWSAEWISCLIQVPTFFCWIGAQYLSIGALVETYLGVPSWIGAIGSCVFVLVILRAGGLWAVTWTNSLLVAVSIASVVILFFGTASTLGDGSIFGGVHRVLTETPHDQLSFFPDFRLSTILGVLGVFLTGLLGNIPGQDLQQRVLSATSPRVAAWSCVISSVIYLVIGMIPVYVGLAAKLHLPDRITEADVQGDRVLPVAAPYFLSEPLVIVLVLGLISVNLAVAASSTISQTTILDRNVLGFLRRNDNSRPNYEKGCVLVVSIGSLLAAFSGNSIMGLLEISLVLVMVSLFVPMCLCLFAKTVAPWTGVASMLSGAAVWGGHLAVEAWMQPATTSAMEPASEDSTLALYLAVPAEIQGLAASFLVAVIVQYWSRTPRATTR